MMNVKVASSLSPASPAATSGREGAGGDGKGEAVRGGQGERRGGADCAEVGV
jgi:hypothetical protein